MRVENIADRAASYGFPGVVADGNDVLVMHAVAAEAVARARAGSGPTLIEAKSYRMTPHSAFATGATSTEEELAAWRAKDPIDRLTVLLLKRGVSQQRLDEIIAQVAAEIETATESAIAAPPPSADQAGEDVYAPSEWLLPGRLA